MNTFLKRAIDSLVDQKCWGVVAGCGNGSMVTLHCGQQKLRKTPVRNERISKALREFQGEFCVFVKGCAWRLEDKEATICVWDHPEEAIENAMSTLAGTQITAAEVLNWAYDCRIEFESRYTLRMFCDQHGEIDSIDNYSIRVPGTWIIVGPGGNVSLEDSKVVLNDSLTDGV